MPVMWAGAESVGRGSFGHAWGGTLPLVAHETPSYQALKKQKQKTKSNPLGQKERFHVENITSFS